MIFVQLLVFFPNNHQDNNLSSFNFISFHVSKIKIDIYSNQNKKNTFVQNDNF